MCDASGTPAPSYAELESQLAAAVAAREEAERERDEALLTVKALTPAANYCLEYKPLLLAAEARAAEAEADVARIERLHAACDATIRELTSKALAAVRGQEAAEARAERLAGADEGRDAVKGVLARLESREFPRLTPDERDTIIVLRAILSAPPGAVREAAQSAADDLGNVLYNIEVGERAAAEEQAREIRDRLRAALAEEVRR